MNSGDNHDHPFNKKTSLERSNGRYELPDITEEIPCPVCNVKDLTMTRTIYRLPDGDDIIILLMECNHCSYKKSDTVSLYSAFKPGEYNLNVDDGDLTHKIFRGATGEILIPEIGVEIERGPAATFQFTNVEGIFFKIQEQLNFFLRTTPADTIEYSNAKTSLQNLELCLSGSLPFHVILRDHEGGSYITPTHENKMIFTPYKK